MEQAYIYRNNQWQGLYTTFGALLVKGAYEALLTPPAMKDYIIAESRMAHGASILVDANTAKKKQREITLSIFISGSTVAEYLTRYDDFISAITQGIFQLKVPRIGLIYNLVYSSCTKYGNYGEKRGKFALRLIEPNPENRETI